MKKTLQFDYFPLMRSNYDLNPLVQEDVLRDELNVYWNGINIFKDIQSSKETFEKGYIKRHTDIDLVLGDNLLLLDNTQTWQASDSIKLHAQINLKREHDDIWKMKFLYNLTTTDNDAYQSFNNKFGLSSEMFHFKLNGAALLYNEEVRGGRKITAEKDFYWRGKNPILFELEEYGTGIEADSRFIQIVRFTIL
jgi:hypothetical protein